MTLNLTEDLSAFIGFNILMGIVQMPTLYDYWSSSSSFHYFPIASRISHCRFLTIRCYLHFVNNDTLQKRGEPRFDKLGKIRNLIKIIDSNFLTAHHPNKECSIDEAMIRFKRRTSLKQYLPMKPIKRGIKV